MTSLTTTNDGDLMSELVKTAKVNAINLIEIQVRGRIRELREQQQAALLALVEKKHKRPEESPTNKLFEAQITELEDVIASCEFYKESLDIVVDLEVSESSHERHGPYTETVL